MEFKTTLKTIKAYNAIDISNMSCNAVYDITRGGYERICYSAGLYGCNGAVIKAYSDGQYYKAVGRCSNLFIIL